MNREMNREVKNSLTLGLFWVLYVILVGLLLVKLIAYLNG
jgi:hypothetical protein